MKKLVTSYIAVCLFVVYFLSVCTSQAATLVASADTYITENPYLGGTKSLHGSDDRIYLIGAINCRAFPLMRFDLQDYSGYTVQGNATVDFYLFDSWNSVDCMQNVYVYEEYNNWNEGFSWNNLPGPYGDVGPILDMQTVIYDPSE